MVLSLKTYTPSTVIVMPEECDISWEIFKATNCYAVCSDYVSNLK